MPSRRFVVVAGCVIIVAAAAGMWWWHARTAAAAPHYQTPEEATSVYVRFDMEAFDDIQQNYWMQPSQFDLPTIFALSAQKVTGATSTVATSTRAATAAMLAGTFAAATSTDEERAWAADIVTVVLYNLLPTGRDQLLSQAQETALRQEVSNVKPQTDLYGDLGLAKGASATDVDAAYQQQKVALEASSSPEAKQQLQTVTYAHDVLTNPESKTLYDQTQAQPTVFGHVIGHTLYLDLSQIAPTTLAEFAYAVDAASTTPGLDSLLVDLRGNIGGALDFAQGFMGLFVGQNQYAFDLFHQGDYQAQRTTQPQWPELARYKNVALLVDQMTQSTAELTSASMQRYHLATVVGTTTRGWGSVENTYPLKTVIDPATSYTLLLVNSLTLGSNEQPIEQNGVVPDVSISDANWKSELSQTVHSASLVSAIEQLEARDPWEF